MVEQLAAITAVAALAIDTGIRHKFGVFNAHYIVFSIGRQGQ
jgi:hypothetical protein